MGLQNKSMTRINLQNTILHDSYFFQRYEHLTRNLNWNGETVHSIVQRTLSFSIIPHFINKAAEVVRNFDDGIFIHVHNIA